MTNADKWLVLCGEMHPTSGKRCIKIDGHTGLFHNCGDGRAWADYTVEEYLIDWWEERVLPSTWLFGVTPPMYDDEDEMTTDLLTALRTHP